MTAREQIFGQNWIEQFRRERKRIALHAPIRGAGMWAEGRDIFETFPSYDACEIVNEAFPWDETPEGHLGRNSLVR